MIILLYLNFTLKMNDNNGTRNIKEQSYENFSSENMNMHFIFSSIHTEITKHFNFEIKNIGERFSISPYPRDYY
jgi:hypothetical protein